MDEKAAPAGSEHLPLPPQPTPFIGREEELAEIATLLAKPTCRLLTLSGPGGIGKSRLALEAAQKIGAAFAGDIYFVDLRRVDEPDHLATAIAAALHLPLSGQTSPATQLPQALTQRQLLLLLDGFEHLLPPSTDSEEAGELLATILAHAPQVKILVTSRAALKLQEEWLYAVSGLPVPPAGEEAELARYGAVQLFAERAQRVRHDFTIAADPAGVARICRLVEGMPLALELAGAWMKTLDCGVIAAEIQQNLAFLTTPLHNVPNRHRSVQAVFEQSWRRLSPEVRAVFTRLSVFRGSFTRNAAASVAGASLSTLSTLVDRSLVRRERKNRYQLHDLLRQAAAARLDQSPDTATQIRGAHCEYYTAFLAQQRQAMMGGDQTQAIAEIGAELDNIRAAWQWAVEQTDVAALRRAAYAYSYFLDFQSRYHEGIEVFTAAVASLDLPSPAGEQKRGLAELLLFLGWFYIRVGRHEEAKSLFGRSRSLYETLDVAPRPGLGTDPLTALGIAATVFGDYEEAQTLAKEARRRSHERGDKHNRQLAYYILADAALAQGEVQAAADYAKSAYNVTRETKNHWFMAYVRNVLGHVARAQGSYAIAAGHYQASYELRRSFGDPEGMAVALTHLGRMALQQEQYDEAIRRYRRSLSIYREIGSRGGMAMAHDGLGHAARARRNYGEAVHHFRQAIRVALEIDFQPVALSSLAAVGELLITAGRVADGLQLLAAVSHHPAGEQAIKERARSQLHHFETRMDSEQFTATVARGRESGLDDITETLLSELDSLKFTSPDEEGKASPPEQRLVEPLTPRELEVLHLIARGLTNKAIAAELILSVGTVKWYTSQIYGKLDVNNRTQAVARARDLHMLSES